jgi:hypothetical protein
MLLEIASGPWANTIELASTLLVLLATVLSWIVTLNPEIGAPNKLPPLLLIVLPEIVICREARIAFAALPLIVEFVTVTVPTVAIPAPLLLIGIYSPARRDGMERG